MSKGCDAVKDITDSKEIWRLAVKVDDIWIVTQNYQEHAEMVLRDVKGDAIHVIIGPDEYKKRKDQVTLLQKMDTYIIKNFRVLKNDEKYKYADHAFKLAFISGTGINAVEIPDMPVSAYKFKKFEEIKAFQFREDLLYDVIGAVHEIGSAQTTASAGKLNISFTVKDLAGNIVDCILWEAVAKKFIEHCKNRAESGPMIIIFRRARLILPTERFPLQISNAWSGTNIIINEDVPEINEFQKSLPVDNTYGTQNPLISSSSQRFSTQSSVVGSQLSPEDQFIQGHRILKLSDITKLNQDEIIITVVTTHHIKPTERGWYFLGCTSCIKQTFGNGPPYECKPLRHQTEVPVIRYKVDVEVKDGNDSARFVFWDSTCIELLGTTAGELKKTMLEDGLDDPLDYPQQFNEMMNRKFLFRLKWQKDWRAGSVLEIKDNKEMVDKIEQQLKSGIAPTIIPKPPSTSAAQSSESKEVEVSATLLADDDIIMELSATSEHDPDKLSKVTPSKRCSMKDQDDDIPIGQLSSNKNTKMKLRNVKMEKAPV